MNAINNISDIAQIIQLAVAPVFLLTGIAAFLGVLSNRLGRITDRARVIERRVANTSGEQQESLQLELVSLWKRVSLTNNAIRLCTTSALLVCLMVVTLFLGDVAPFDISLVVALLFISSMGVLIIGLLYFLREVTRATRTMRIGMEIVVEDIHRE
ncbi:MAG: DUF2721 domain-containing protein [Pseudomonadales bacterium]